MNDAVFDELGMKPKQMGAYFSCPSDNLTGLGDDAFNPYALQQLVGPSTPPPGTQFSVSANAPDDLSAAQNFPGIPTYSTSLNTAAGPDVSTPYGPITPIVKFAPDFYPGPATPLSTAAPGSSWEKSLAASLSAAMKAGTPIAQAEIAMQMQQTALRNQPIHVPIGAGGKLPTKSSLSPWIIGGGVGLLVLLGLVVYSARK